MKGIITDINSGGGAWTGQTAVMDWLMSARNQKPMVAYINGMGCSAAMALAMQHSMISASRDSEVASLGTVAKHVYYKDDNQIVNVLRSGKKKALGYVSGEALTDEALQTLKERLNEVNDMFLVNCSRGRPQNSVEFLKSLEGADMIASQGLEKGLIDNVCSFDSAVERLQEMIRMNELLQALGATNEKDGLEKLQSLKDTIQTVQGKAQESETKLAAVDGIVKMTNATIAKLNEVTGQPSLEQSVATVSAWKIAVDSAPAKDLKIQGLEKANVEIRMTQVLEKNQAKITADIKPKIEEQRELAMAAGKDPVAVVQSFLDAVQPTIDLTNFTPGGAGGSANEGPNTLTDEQERYFTSKGLEKYMTREEFTKTVKGLK